ncbi:AAA family ATPase [Microbacterium sp. CPCC 204701]|uniref:AAA family ATPase n=1 Tax=Microbacterium sp. CPCC 204701 TaxID=2493084 RepID=UPI000FD74C94|nr:AAA family ATPase [Microbacterium sp. CPCC 204701]
MRIVVSGTHGSGKSTLIGDFAAARRTFEVLPDPFELIDAVGEEPEAGLFLAQLHVAADRLRRLSPGEQVIAERGPLDFVAYLDALDDLRRPGRAPGLRSHASTIAASAMANVDLLVLLPLTTTSGIDVPDDEDPELREAMNAALLDLADEADLVGDATVVEIIGDPASRLAQLEAAIDAAPDTR